MDSTDVLNVVVAAPPTAERESISGSNCKSRQPHNNDVNNGVGQPATEVGVAADDRDSDPSSLRRNEPIAPLNNFHIIAAGHRTPDDDILEQQHCGIQSGGDEAHGTYNSPIAAAAAGHVNNDVADDDDLKLGSSGNADDDATPACHVNTRHSDLVDQSVWCPREAPIRRNLKKILVKSRTCANFYCDSDTATTTAVAAGPNSQPISIKAEKGLQRKKLFPSFSHPDTNIVFTDEDLLPYVSRTRCGPTVSLENKEDSPPPQSTNRRNWRNWRRRDPELSWSFNSSKDFLSDRKVRYSVFTRGGSESEEATCAGGATGDDTDGGYTIISVHPEIAVKVRNHLDSKGNNKLVSVLSEPAAANLGSQSASAGDDLCEECTKYGQLKSSRSESDVECGAVADVLTRNVENSSMEESGRGGGDDDSWGLEHNIGGGDNEEGKLTAEQQQQQHQPLAEDHKPVGDSELLVAATKYFQESGILGPVSTMGNASTLFRKSSKVNIIDNLQFEQIRKHSRTIQRVDKSNKTRPTDLLHESLNNRVAGEKHKEELSNLRELLKKRDAEIDRLKREIHKLKSVLQQTTEAPIETGLISRIQSPLIISNQTERCSTRQTNNDIEDGNIGKQLKGNSNFLSIKTATTPPFLSNPVAKKQGVSAESSDNKQQLFKHFNVETHEKDFKSKQIIKDAILDNDFLKHLASSQIKELVESMYRKELYKGDYVIREGESGAHLYVSDEGEFEVIKDNVVLGKMGPGKAFGELAILYNCTRTASIRVLSDSKVWVLDRLAFQQIMMRTGMQKIEENINFLRSVPLLKNLGLDSLAKIADVLDLEFYPTGTYIIRQDTSGDSFFLISQGNVKVTQRLPGTKIEEEIRILGRGDYFGEQALIKEDKRTANIIALSPGVECLTLDRESFIKYIGDLSELHEIDYGDESRALSFKENEREILSFAKSGKQQLLHIGLSDLEVVTTLGVGGFGRVELVKYCGGSDNAQLMGSTDKERHHRQIIQTYALKCLKKQHILDTKQEEHVFNERTIMMSCDSPFICRLYRTYRDNKYVYMLLEACLGGEVWTILRNRGYFDEYSGQFITGCVIQAFQYLHCRGIVYRDLKPENLLLDANGYVKLVDFGFAKYIGFSSKTWTFCGTPEYVAPEIILNKGHDRAVDYWALGILVYELLTGAPPFTSTDPMKTYNIILKNLMEFPRQVSKTAINLIKRLCKDVPVERLGYQRGGIQEIKKHKWFQGFDWDGLEIQTLSSPILNHVESAIDTSHFDSFPIDTDLPPDEFSGWDMDF